jgi:hypothetical protein
MISRHTASVGVRKVFLKRRGAETFHHLELGPRSAVEVLWLIHLSMSPGPSRGLLHAIKIAIVFWLMIWLLAAIYVGM